MLRILVPVLAATVALLFVYGVARVRGGRAAAVAAVGVAAWMALFLAIADSGVLLRTDLRPPPFFGMVIAIFGAAFALARSRLGAALAELPLWALVGIHGFRLPLELAMHDGAADGIVPTALTFGGYNFDIVTGATAIVVAGLAAAGRAPRRLLLAWNLLGTALLAVIAVIAIATAPAIRALGDDQVNTWVATVPYVWVPTVLVVSALAGHLIVFRRLLGVGAAPVAP